MLVLVHIDSALRPIRDTTERLNVREEGPSQTSDDAGTSLNVAKHEHSGV